MSLRIYNAALKYLGTAEVDGPASNPRIKAWIKQAAEWLNGDDSKTPWCGAFRGGIGYETATGCPPEHFRAIEWAKWGVAVPVKRPLLWRKGDTIVMSRTGGNHVCILDRVEGDIAYCLGGNQKNKVSIAPFDITRITHVRRSLA